ncbi:uncharacterized protein BXZ73DRAFT_104033 [Epithele typhae]|uniref:uncharacterized protein n=1 Tax=Epithele typhae TaxID=378194 RepID=UPI002007C06D|nr:uncharacterized protein BXZ73DRAFT_104033 [Epithele typhae]KAH9922799.1 hypothetical protein BXZ73DRAFT_104033 [Epithele typhae]
MLALSFRAPRPAPPRPALQRRWAGRQANPWAHVETATPEKAPFQLRTWVRRVSRIGNFVLVPSIILYAVFVHDFGDYEHVFSPPRRWLQSQTAAFYTLSPEEQKLAGLEPASANAAPTTGALQGVGKPS